MPGSPMELGGLDARGAELDVPSCDRTLETHRSLATLLTSLAVPLELVAVAVLDAPHAPVVPPATVLVLLVLVVAVVAHHGSNVPLVAPVAVLAPSSTTTRRSLRWP